MITDPTAITVLCFGDSNTHGAPSDDPAYVRLGPDVRWTGQLQDRLGPGYAVIEEGLNGRTIDLDYLDRPGLNGSTYLRPCLESQYPVDVLVLMLGTNDLKIEFDRPAAAIAGSWYGPLDIVAEVLDDPAVFLVSPIHLDETRPGFAGSDSFDRASAAKSRELSELYQRIAADRGVNFLDAAVAATAGDDGVHLTVGSHRRLAELLYQAILAAG
jgi:lysophospholipase L1-like esterase